MLRPALGSVINQTYPNIEIIFVDNLSSDGSAALARQMLESGPRKFTITECPLRGANFARNHGYQFASGDYIQWMDADDELQRNKIALQVAALQRAPEDDIAYGDWMSRQHFAGGPPLIDRHLLRQIPDQLLRTLAGVWYPPHLYLLRRRGADRLQQAQAFWPGRAVGMDAEYSAIAALLGLRFRYVAGACVYYNIWSKHQISNATPLAVRAAGLHAIFQRLQRLARTLPTSAHINPQHKILLFQNWDIWNVPRGSISIVKAGGRHSRLKHNKSGREISARPKEVAVATALMAVPIARTICHHALSIAARIPELSEQHAFIVQTLERLRQAEFLELAAHVGPEDTTSSLESTNGLAHVISG